MMIMVIGVLPAVCRPSCFAAVDSCLVLFSGENSIFAVLTWHFYDVILKSEDAVAPENGTEARTTVW